MAITRTRASSQRPLLVACVLVHATAVAAQPTDPTEKTASAVEPRPGEPTLPTERPRPAPVPPDVTRAPLPGQESGRIDAGDGGDSAARRFFRGVLFLPRVTIDLVLLPVHTALWAEERYSLDERYRRTFFSRDEKMGMYPTIWYESGFYPRLGARFFERDAFGANERLTLTGEFGREYQGRIEGTFRTGERLGERVELELHATYDRQPREYFFGIGNSDESEVFVMPIDPIASDEAFETRYRSRLARASILADVGVWESLHARGAASLSDSTFTTSEEGPPIETVYEVDQLPGFTEGVRSLYLEGALRWDDRDRGSPMETPAIYATGSFASVFAGPVFTEDTTFLRYGVDLQQFIRIAEGPRVLSLRLYGEAVTGSVDEVPFNELPRLGGTYLLRGYRVDRFRDRVATVGSAEYRWDVARFLMASVFVDVGRVYPSIEDLTFSDLRLGYGIGLEAHTARTFLANLSLASSIDGGVFVTLAFDPVFDLKERVRRR